MSITPEQEQRYQQLFGDSAGPAPLPINPASKVPFPFQRMTSELAAVRRVQRAMNRQRELLVKDGFSEQEITELLESYEESWATGLVKQRAAQTKDRWPLLTPQAPGTRYTWGCDEASIFWIYDLQDLEVYPNGKSEPRRLLNTSGALEAERTCELILESGTNTIADMMGFRLQAHMEVFDKYGERAFAIPPRRRL